jgi:hypothetical protein
MRFLQLSFWRNLLHQLLSIGCLVIFSLCASIAVKHVLDIGTSTIVQILLAGIFYSIMVVAVVYFFLSCLA